MLHSMPIRLSSFKMRQHNIKYNWNLSYWTTTITDKNNQSSTFSLPHTVGSLLLLHFLHAAVSNIFFCAKKKKINKKKLHCLLGKTFMGFTQRIKVFIRWSYIKHYKVKRNLYRKLSRVYQIYKQKCDADKYKYRKCHESYLQFIIDYLIKNIIKTVKYYKEFQYLNIKKSQTI